MSRWISRPRSHLDLFISVREGMQYRVGDMTCKGNELFADSVISRLVTMKNGEVFDDSEFHTQPGRYHRHVRR